jgi:hypothetical protein
LLVPPARILIVDDEPFKRDVLIQELELLALGAEEHLRKSFNRCCSRRGSAPVSRRSAGTIRRWRI